MPQQQANPATISGHNDFPCPVGRTVEEAVTAIRSGYGLINGFILRNEEATFPNDTITADGNYQFVNFEPSKFCEILQS
jgi:hypothetical protein